MSQVAIVIPAMRPHRIAPVVQSIQESTEDYHIIVLATGDCADAARSLPVTLIDDGGGTWPQRINRGIVESTEQFVVTGADDLLFQPGWFEAALIAMNQLPDGSGIVGINDLYNMNGVHFMAERSYIQNLGVIDEPGKLACELYEHQFCDDEIRATAISRGRWIFCHDAIIEHLHVGAGKAPMDKTYAIGEASASQGHGVFISRVHLWTS